MRHVASAFLALGFGFAQADLVDTFVKVPGWTISTSENLYTKGPSSYPIQNMLDGDPATAWVYRGRDYPKPVTYNGQRFDGSYYIGFERELPWLHGEDDEFFVDELRIMNGYNKSPQHFLQNSRAVEIELFDGRPWGQEKPLRTVKLSDEMGMKSVRVPARKYHALYVRVSGIARGPIDDLCISEIQIRAAGKPLIKLGPTFAESLGSECGCGTVVTLRTRSGKHVGKTNVESGEPGFDPTGRTYAGIDRNVLWTADARTGRILSRRAAKPRTYWSAEWTKHGKLEVNASQ